MDVQLLCQWNEEVEDHEALACNIAWEAFNKSNSSVRALHRPSGLTVTVQDERTQYGAKVAALRHLRFKLAHKRQQELRADKARRHRGCSSQTFSNQIRNYVETPYRLIKDTRSKAELRGHAVADALQNGNIDVLLKASLDRLAAEELLDKDTLD